MRGVGLASLVCCGAAMALPAAANAAASVPITKKRYACVSHDGTNLDGTLSRPVAAGKRPIVVVPGVWPQDVVTQVTNSQVAAEYLAMQGYATFTYSQRGFGGSGGLVDGGGPLTVKDVSSAIDCVARDAEGDTRRVAVLGLSYGGAIGLLAAAQDPRIKAVVAGSAWSDINQAFRPAQTRRGVMLTQLVFGAVLLGRVDPEFVNRMTLAGFNIGVPELLAYGKVRSAKTYVSQINANKPAIMLSQNFDDSLFDPNQAKSFYDALAGPKRLMLQPGEHVWAESKAYGDRFIGNNVIWSSAFRWLDRYVKGERNGIDTELPVQVDPFGPAPRESYATTGEGAVARTFTLGGRSGADGEGSMVENGPATAWAWTIGGGYPSKADNGVFGSAIDNFESDQKTVKVAGSAIDHRLAGVWTSPVVAAKLRIRGTAGLNLRVTPNLNGPFTVFAYLYDVDETGVGRLVTSAPFTNTWAGAYQPANVALTFTDTAYDLPAGHRLRVAVDTVDGQFIDQTTGAALTFAGKSDRPSRLTVPVRP